MIENGLAATPAPPRALPSGGRRARFGFFGQITEFKGLHVLLEAVTRSRMRSGDDATLSIFGGNLEFQPAAFQRFDSQPDRARRPPRPLLRQLPLGGAAAADGQL